MGITAYGSLPNKETLKAEPGPDAAVALFRESGHRAGRRLGKLDRTLRDVRLKPCSPSATGWVFGKAA